MVRDRLRSLRRRLRRRRRRLIEEVMEPAIARTVVSGLERSGIDVLPALGELKYCPICGELSAKWDPGPNGRPDAACPGCASLERHRIMWLVLHARSRLLVEPGRVLHASPEPFLRKRLKELPGIRYTTVDLSRPDVDVNADLCDLPFEDGTFDHIVCSHVLEHIPDDDRAMRELRRVLAREGTAIVNVPLRWDRPTEEDPDAPEPERVRRFGQADHVRYYGPDVEGRLEAAGFEVSRVCPGRELPPGLGALLRIHDEPIFVCSPRV